MSIILHLVWLRFQTKRETGAFSHTSILFDVFLQHPAVHEKNANKVIQQCPSLIYSLFTSETGYE